MKLESLQLTNFRGFRELAITFDPQFTVLLGGNMAGKTAVLDAAAFVLRRLLGTKQARNIEDDEVHQVVVSSGGVQTLNLNAPQLRRGRQEALDEIRRRLDKAGYSPSELKKIAHEYQISSGIRMPEYAESVRYYVLKKLRIRGESL